jgi:hypothetical protein
LEERSAFLQISVRHAHDYVFAALGFLLTNNRQEYASQPDESGFGISR